MFNFLKKKSKQEAPPLTTDIHSHLLPGLDDGVQSLEEAEEIVLFFKDKGYRKLITTPHIMPDHYPNTPQGIREKLAELKKHLDEKNIAIEIEAAAEHYLDESLVSALQADSPMLTFGDNYLLFETNFISEPLNLKEFIFLANTKGYKPVLAHPERYLYLQSNFAKIEDLAERGVYFQINLASLVGHYSKAVQTVAGKLIDKGFVHLLGSDCHHRQHLPLIEKARNSRYFKKALTLPLLNNHL